MCLCAPGLRVDWEERDQGLDNVISVPPEIYAKGCVHDVDDGLAVSILRIKPLDQHLYLFSFTFFLPLKL